MAESKVGWFGEFRPWKVWALIALIIAYAVFQIARNGTRPVAAFVILCLVTVFGITACLVSLIAWKRKNPSG